MLLFSFFVLLDSDAPAPPPAPFEPIGRFSSAAVIECSGLVASRTHADVFWTHNDSGNKAEIFAVRRDGTILARVAIAGANNQDWEDIAIDGHGRLFIGDIGDNWGRFPERRIYEVPEPDPFHPPSEPVPPAAVWTFSWPDRRYNCEALFVHADAIYVITKSRRELPTLFRLDRSSDNTLTPTRVCTLPAAFVTAADVSADGRCLALCSYGRAWVMPLPADLANLQDAEPKVVVFPFDPQVEALAFDGADVLIAAESREIWRIRAEDFEAGRRFRAP